jgi:hypothetical protein
MSRKLFAMLVAATFTLGAAVAARAQLPPLPNDHLLGYKVAVDTKATPAGTPFPKGHFSSIIDQFGPHGTCAVKKQAALYNPADKNGEGIQDSNRHYLSYRVACDDKHVDTRTFFDQFFPAGISIAALKERFVLIPAGKSTTLSSNVFPPPAGTNRYLCYKAKAAPITAVTVMVQDQFDAAPRAFELTKIQAVCNPAGKDGDDPGAAGDPDHYVCYKAKPATKLAAPTVRTNTIDYGANTFAPKKAFELCVPAFKDVVPPTTTTTLGPCGGGPFSCGGTCPPGGECAPIDDFPPYCGCIPDGSQACESVDWPYCNGQCGGGQTCGSEANVPNAACICVATPPACGDSSYPTCGGSCLAGESCFAFKVVSYTFCGCATAAPCPSTCGGSGGGQCPPGEVCYVATGTCGCAP